MSNLFVRFDVDEVTPVQFVGVYTTKWRPEWGEPTVMFAEAEDGDLFDAARQLPEVKALIAAARDAQQHLCFFCEAAKKNGGACPGHCPDVVNLDAALAPFLDTSAEHTKE